MAISIGGNYGDGVQPDAAELNWRTCEPTAGPCLTTVRDLSCRRLGAPTCRGRPVLSDPTAAEVWAKVCQIWFGLWEESQPIAVGFAQWRLLAGGSYSSLFWERGQRLLVFTKFKTICRDESMQLEDRILFGELLPIPRSLCSVIAARCCPSHSAEDLDAK